MSMGIKMQVKICCGLQHGDEAKGKVSAILQQKQKFDYVCRASGGPNAGHTIYNNDKKHVLHHIPSGVLYNTPCIIGAGCVVNTVTFFEELKELKEFNAEKLVKVAYNTHVITNKHVIEDCQVNGNGVKVGSTGRGIMPSYRDKYARIGTRAESVLDPHYICDPYELFKNANHILIEGAQGFNLCPDHGDYPFVTSSSPTAAYALHSLGIAPSTNSILVYGAAKVYETYVGSKSFQPDDEIFSTLQKLGSEYGATTGRPRQCNWLNLDTLQRAVDINGAQIVIMSKCDVLEKLDTFKLYHHGKVVNFSTLELFKTFIRDNISAAVYFSGTKDGWDDC